jgi:hypothetical protein
MLFTPTLMLGVFPDYLEVVWYHDLLNLVK